MATAQLKDPSGADKGTVDLPAEIFESEINRHVMWQAVVNYLKNQRQGTVQTKTRKTISGGGVKPWRQKGTGRARSGSTRTVVWVGGPPTKGPHPRDWYGRLPKKVRSLALRSALTVRAKDGRVTVLTGSGVADGRTKEVAQMVKSLGLGDQKCLLVVDGHDPMVIRAGRNMERLNTTNAHQIHAYEVLWADHVLVTQKAVDALKEVRS
ncbi:MAG: 50S ribosomal protein L4 [Candidatus Eisenbacteria bacterium]|uniref:Large ribosomal subunit protein uL4 n=1 Tax=Eiseniibacteriota bacterium TaxID=2212470 RepID=A0A956M208_UNCEI|nr:50S ribosomal protein L4 [Candidatus Eisenbacteria bacterium]